MRNHKRHCLTIFPMNWVCQSRALPRAGILALHGLRKPGEAAAGCRVSRHRRTLPCPEIGGDAGTYAPKVRAGSRTGSGTSSTSPTVLAVSLSWRARLLTAIASTSVTGLVSAFPATESLVDVSLSTETVLSIDDTASRNTASRRRDGMFASVTRHASMVAMFGWIIPAPLAIPVTVAFPLPKGTVLEIPFGTASVAMTARAARIQLRRPRPGTHKASASPKHSTGSCPLIIPAENGAAWSRLQPGNRAAVAQVLRTCPRESVPALAIPELTTSARMPMPARRWRRHTWAGTAGHRLM